MSTQKLEMLIVFGIGVIVGIVANTALIFGS